MSRSLQLFFNLKDGASVHEFHDELIDLFLEHDFVDDRSLAFSDYQCYLAVYKLFDHRAAEIAAAFVSLFWSVKDNIDFSKSPLLVFDLQLPVATLDENNVLVLTGDQSVWEQSFVTKLIVDLLQQASAS